MKWIYTLLIAVLLSPAAGSAQEGRPEGRLYGSAASALQRTNQANSTNPTNQTNPSDSLQLSLNEAVRRAIDNNPDLASVRFGTQIESERVAQSESAYTPVFSTAIAASSNVTPPSNFLLGERGVDTNDLFSSTGVRQRLAWGSGTWNLSWDTSRTTTDSPLTSFDPSLQSGFQFAFSQPLLKDRKMDLARQQTIVTRRNLESAELSVREAVVQTTAAVKQAYWTLKATLANVTVQQRSLELAQELARQNKARVDIGQTPPLDLLQAEAEVAQRRENLIRANTAVGDAEDRLRRLIMDPGDASFWRVRINPTDEPVVGGVLPDVDAIAAGGFAGRYDLQRARKDLENIGTNVDFFSNQKLPDVRLETSFRSSGLGGTRFLRSGGFPGTVTGTVNRGYGSVLGDMFGSSYPSWSFGLTVNYPLGRSFEEAGLARAQVERRQAAQRIASLQLAIGETVRQSVRQVHSTAERIEAARAGQTVARQRLDVEQRRFEVGLSTSFLVTQAQRDLLQTEVNLLQAMLDHQSALVSFEALQEAPALNGAEADLRGAPVVPVPITAPQGLFRPGSASGF